MQKEKRECKEDQQQNILNLVTQEVEEYTDIEKDIGEGLEDSGGEI